MQVAFKNNSDLVSSVTSQEFVLSLSAGVRFASDTWAAFGITKGFKAFLCQMELFHELGLYRPDLELPDRFAYIPVLVMLAAGTAPCTNQCLAVWSSIR